MQSRGRLIAELILLAVLTLTAYTVLWSAQNALWSNGLSSPQLSPALPRPGADASAGLDQSVRVMLLGAAVTFLAAWLIGRAARFAAVGLGWLVVAIPTIVAIGFFILPPTLSIDAYSYLSHGYLAATPGSNPYVEPSSSVMATPFGGVLLHNGWQPVHGLTPYGPLWTAFERAAYVLSGGSVPVGIVLIKIPTFLAVIGTAILIYRLLGEIAPERRFAGVMLFIANPLVLIELVGDGHNDAVMVFFVVLSVFATVRRWAFVAVVAMVLAALVKLDALPLGLLVLVALILWRRSVRRVVLELVAAVAVSLAAVVGLFAPYWVGTATLDGLFTQGTPAPGLSVSGMLSSFLPPGAAQVVLSALLVLATVAACFFVRTVRGFIRACGLVGLVILVLLPLEWPWYAALPSALLALEASELDMVLVLLLALGSRIVAPFGDANAIGAMSYALFSTSQPLFAQTIPGLIGVWATARRLIAGGVPWWPRRGPSTIGAVSRPGARASAE